jgi:pimeloyl-ACP methyl ester carboxylesterase
MSLSCVCGVATRSELGNDSTLATVTRCWLRYRDPILLVAYSDSCSSAGRFDRVGRHDPRRFSLGPIHEMKMIMRPASLPGFEHARIDTGEVHLHAVTGGVGDALVLLPGWPQTWWAWRKVMPLLGKKYKVIAVDPRGLGDSDRPSMGYDTRTAAMDVHRLLEGLGERHFYLVGHDVGAWIAFACAAVQPERIRRLVLLDAAIPGISPQEAYQLSPRSTTWQFHFHAVPEIPEMLTAKKEKEYLEWFFRNKSVVKEAIQEDDVLEYVRCYSAPGAMATGFAYYRAVFEDAEQNREYAKTPLRMPILAIGGAGAAGKRLYEAVRTAGTQVSAAVVENCGHYIPEEQPRELCELMMSFFAEG